jgi:hypothetical protein
MELPNDDGPILCLFRIVLAVVLVLVIGRFTRLFDCDYDDEDDDDSKIPPSTELGALVALAKPSLMQPCRFSGCGVSDLQSGPSSPILLPR